MREFGAREGVEYDGWEGSRAEQSRKGEEKGRGRTHSYPTPNPFSLSEELSDLNEDLRRYKRATLLEVLKGDSVRVGDARRTQDPFPNRNSRKNSPVPQKRKIRGRTALELDEVFETIKCRPRDILTIEDFIKRLDRIADFTTMEAHRRGDDQRVDPEDQSLLRPCAVAAQRHHLVGHGCHRV